MTEKVKELITYCGDHDCDCQDCKVEYLCTKIDGAWGEHPAETDVAYETLQQERESNTVKDDNVNHPTHYTQGTIECIDAMESAFGKESVMTFCLCNAFKYTWRSKLKNGKEDVEKAQWYLDKYVELLEKGDTNADK